MRSEVRSRRSEVRGQTFLFSVFCCLSSVLWFLSSVFCPLSAQAKVVDRIVAIVNNDVITLYDLDRAVAGRRADRHQVLEDLIDQKLIHQEITKSNIEVTDQDLAMTIDSVLQKNGINIEILRAELASKGVSFEAYREQLREQIRQAKFIQQNLVSEVQATDRDVRRYQSQQADKIDASATARLAWIYFPLDPEASNKEIRHLVRKGRKLTDRARRGEDFGKLNKDHWEGSKLLSDLSPPLADLIRKMEANSVSDPIVTPHGVYVVKLYEKSLGVQEKPKSHGDLELKQSAYNDRMEKEMKNFVFQLRRKAYIDIRE